MLCSLEVVVASGSSSNLASFLAMHEEISGRLPADEPLCGAEVAQARASC